MYYYTPWKFFTPALADILSLESEWQQVSLGLQDSPQYSDQSKQCCNIWMVFFCSLIFNSFSLLSKTLWIVPSMPVTIGITFMCHSFLSCLLLLFYSLWVFHLSVSWWSFTGVWVTASLLRSPAVKLGSHQVWKLLNRKQKVSPFN